MQRIYQIAQLRKECETQNGIKIRDGLELFNIFNANLTVTHGEKISPSYMTLAMNVHDHVLANPSARALLLAADEWFGKKGPLESLYKLEAVYQVARNPGHLVWALQCLFDQVCNRELQSGEVTVTTLTGRKTAVGKGRLVAIVVQNLSLSD